MRVLYIFPHPDDESFGPAGAIAAQRRNGHEVFLLTLTRGGATKVRHKWGWSVEEMGRVRLQEMRNVASVLDLTGMTVLDLPDSGLKELDPREIEQVISEHITAVKPDVVVTYAVHGISGFHDHLVTHAVVKRVFCAMRDRHRPGWTTALSEDDQPTGGGSDTPNSDRQWCAPARLALFTLGQSEEPDGMFRLNTSTPDEIDCAIPVSDSDVEKASRALDCYETYREVIKKARVLERTGRIIYFELFQEAFDPPLDSLFDRLPERS